MPLQEEPWEQPPKAPEPPTYEAQPEPQTYEQPQQPQGNFNVYQYQSQPQGQPQGQYQQPQYQQAGQPQYQPNPGVPEDKGSIGWGVLGCCIPIVGLVLFLVWKDSRPRDAKMAGMGALICVGINVVLFLISLVTGALAGL